MSRFGERLKELRKDNNLLNKQLAYELNVEPSTITNWEKGNRFPKDDMLIKLADYFNCSVDYLLGRTNCKNSSICSKQINDINIAFEITKDYPYYLSPDDVANMLNILDGVGYDIKRLVYISKNRKL